MDSAIVLPPLPEGADGALVVGSGLVLGHRPFTSAGENVAPQHVHHEHGEARCVTSGALHFRFPTRRGDRSQSDGARARGRRAHLRQCRAWSRALRDDHAPRLHELISRLHGFDRADHARIYKEYASELVE